MPNAFETIRPRAADTRPIYVLAADVIKSRLESLPLRSVATCEESDMDFANTYVVVPTAVVQELARCQLLRTYESRQARVALNLLREREEAALMPMGGHYYLHGLSEPPEEGTAKVLVLPVHQDFVRQLPFGPTADDVDGQTILAALSVTFTLAGLRVDGTELHGNVNRLEPNPRVWIITNNDCLAVRALARGVQTRRLTTSRPTTPKPVLPESTL